MNIRLDVKNMVCNRCIKVVRDELIKHEIDFVRIDLGAIFFDKAISQEDYLNIVNILEKEGLELIEDRDSKVVNQIKTIIIEKIHYQYEKAEHQKISAYLPLKIKMEYTQLSKIFSKTEGRTIENYVIAQKVEKAKELLVYDEMTLSEISYLLNYSSPQHLSRQFKKVTGLTPSEFKKIGERKKLDTI